MTARKKTQEQLNSALSAEKQGTKLVQTNSYLSKGSSTAEKFFTQKDFLFWPQLCIYNIVLTNWYM